MPIIDLGMLATEIEGPLGDYNYYYSKKLKKQIMRHKPAKRPGSVQSIRHRACCKHWTLADSTYQHMSRAERDVWRKALKIRGKSEYDFFMSSALTMLNKFDPYDIAPEIALRDFLQRLLPSPSGGTKSMCHAKYRKPRWIPDPKEFRRDMFWQFFDPEFGEECPGGRWRWEWSWGLMEQWRPYRVIVRLKNASLWPDWWEYAPFDGCQRNYFEFASPGCEGNIQYDISMKHYIWDETHEHFRGTTNKRWKRPDYINHDGPNYVYGYHAFNRTLNLNQWIICWAFLDSRNTKPPGQMLLNFHADGPFPHLPAYKVLDTSIHDHWLLYTLGGPRKMLVSWQWKAKDLPIFHEGEVPIIKGQPHPAIQNFCIEAFFCPTYFFGWIWRPPAFGRYEVNAKWMWSYAEAYRPGSALLVFERQARPKIHRLFYVDTMRTNHVRFYDWVPPGYEDKDVDWRVCYTFFTTKGAIACEGEYRIYDSTFDGEPPWNPE